MEQPGQIARVQIALIIHPLRIAVEAHLAVRIADLILGIQRMHGGIIAVIRNIPAIENIHGVQAFHLPLRIEHAINDLFLALRERQRAISQHGHCQRKRDTLFIIHIHSPFLMNAAPFVVRSIRPSNRYSMPGSAKSTMPMESSAPRPRKKPSWLSSPCVDM